MRTYVTNKQRQNAVLKFKKDLGWPERSINFTETFWSFGHMPDPEITWKMSVVLSPEENDIAHENEIKQFTDTTFELVFAQAVLYMTDLQKEVKYRGNPE
jgi:hypothetical protein